MKTLSTLIEDTMYFICVVMIVAVVFWLINTLNGWKEDNTTYNCSVAEISPDFTPAMKDLCRKLRRKQQ
jgi:hypothetical protein